MGAPAFTAEGPIFVADRSTTGTTVVVTLELLLGVGSVIPAGSAAEAMFVIGLGEVPLTVPLISKVILLLAGNVGTTALTVFPEILKPGGQIALLVVPRHAASIFEMPAGTLSVKVVPLAALGPALLSVIK
jgi:hypothetical protein